MSNRLIHSNSPYLIQHAHNPVDWFPWCEEAIIEAQHQDKPIFLSIGYAACHWCHVMAHESFEDPKVAEIMNRFFINIKVDREERPDLDSIYMQAVVAMTGQGGWPMSVFLTPEMKPFFGGTYFPPQRRYNLPSFQEVLLTVARLWKEDRQNLEKSADRVTKALLQSQNRGNLVHAVDRKILDKAVLQLAQAYDWNYGGWGKPPKFPQPMVIEFLLQRASCGDRLAFDLAVHALDAMARGGMYDLVGGGFSRYSTDERWLIPHFEKMLYDNAQLARVYLYAYLLTKRVDFRKVCEETLDFILSEMSLYDPDEPGKVLGFFSSLDADSEGVEGKFYRWSLEEIYEVVTNRQDAEIWIAAHGVTSRGNFEGQNIFQRMMSDDDLTVQFQLPAGDIRASLARARQALYAARQNRIRPGLDDKILVSWNGLAIEAFAEAGRYLNRQDYVRVAKTVVEFILANFRVNGELKHSWREGSAQVDGFLEDYASLINGLIALYQAAPAPVWYKEAKTLLLGMKERFADPAGGFFDTPSSLPGLLFRPKDLQDNATPSGNALAVIALLKMAEICVDYQEIEPFIVFVNELFGYSEFDFRFGGKWLCALNWTLNQPHLITILGDPDHPTFAQMQRVVSQKFRPFLLVAASPFPPSSSDSPALLNRSLLNDLPTAYLCYRFVCRQPVNSIEQLSILLDQMDAAAQAEN